MAEVYYDFSQSLMDSERPTDLGMAELQDYEMVLEEEAYPFEERAIEVHEKNLELMVAGHFNPWIEKSLGQLAGLMPGRYARFEVSSGFIDSIDTYAYRSPAAPGIGLDEATTEQLPEDVGEGQTDPLPESEGGTVEQDDAAEAVVTS